MFTFTFSNAVDTTLIDKHLLEIFKKLKDNFLFQGIEKNCQKYINTRGDHSSVLIKICLKPEAYQSFEFTKLLVFNTIIESLLSLEKELQEYFPSKKIELHKSMECQLTTTSEIAPFELLKKEYSIVQL